MSTSGTPYDRHSLLRQAHVDGLLVYHEDDSTDDAYVVTTADDRPITLAASDVRPFCRGLLVGFRSAATERELDLALLLAATAAGGQCKYCGAPLSSSESARCNVCGKSQIQGAGDN